MSYLMIAVLVFFLCVVGAMTAYKLNKISDDAMFAVAVASLAGSLLWIVAVPLAAAAGLAYLLSSLLAKLIKGKEKKV